MPEYLLYYWPGLPGRGEFVRLALAEGGADWIDVEREGAPDGEPSIDALLGDAPGPHPGFAPPILKHGQAVIAQTPLILAYLADRLGLGPEDRDEARFMMQLLLTIADLTAEAHDTHHPIAVSLRYEDQRSAAEAAAARFREERIPKYLGYFETVLERAPRGGGHLAGGRLSVADIALHHVVEGLRYAFPKAMEAALKDHPRTAGLARAVAERPRIAAYLASDRHQDFNESGVFRRYRELDA